MKKRYIFSAIAIFIVTVFVVMGCGSSSNIGSDNNDSGAVGGDNDVDYGIPKRQGGPAGVPDTLALVFTVVGDMQLSITGGGDHDSDKTKRTQNIVKSINKHYPDTHADYIGMIAVGDLTQHSCCQEVIAFRQMFEDSYPGYAGGSIDFGTSDKDYDYYSNGNKVTKPVFSGLGNHDDPTEHAADCPANPSCSESASDDVCRSQLVNNYLRDRIRGSASLYNPSKLLNTNGVNYYTDPINAGDIYAWEWGSYHFIHTGVWAGYGGHGYLGTEFTQLDPSEHGEVGASNSPTNFTKLNQLKSHLKMNIGDSGKPVLIFQHFGWTDWNFTDGWWTRDSAADLINVLCRRENTADTCNPYNVIGIFSGHIHKTDYRSIYAGKDKDGNAVTFDNYLVNDAGPGSGHLIGSTGYFAVHLYDTGAKDLDPNKGHMQVVQRVVDTNASGSWVHVDAASTLFIEKDFYLPVIDWEQGEPNNAYGIESCAEVAAKGRLYDLDCNLQRTIACRDRGTGELYFSGGKFTWPEAQAACDAAGTDFVRLSTSAEQREFMDMYKSESRAEPVWVNARSPWVYRVDLPENVGDDTEGAGITMADIDGNGKADLIEFTIWDQNNDDSLPNYANYRIGWNPDKDGKTTDWSVHTNIGYGIGNMNQGGGITAGLINDNNITDIVVFYIDNSSGVNHGYYRIGWDIRSTGFIPYWSDSIDIGSGSDGAEEFFTDSSAGGGVAIGDISNNGIPDLIFYNISVHPDELNKGKFIIALDLNSTTGIMTNAAIVSWDGVNDTLTSTNNMGGGVSLADIDGNGQLDLISYFIEDRGNAYPNYAYYDIGWNLYKSGHRYEPTSWTRHRANTDVGNITRYGGIVIGDIDGSDRPDLIMANVMGAHPNKFRYAVARNLNKEGELVTQHLDENGTLVPGN